MHLKFCASKTITRTGISVVYSHMWVLNRFDPCSRFPHSNANKPSGLVLVKTGNKQAIKFNLFSLFPSIIMCLYSITWVHYWLCNVMSFCDNDRAYLPTPVV